MPGGAAEQLMGQAIAELGWPRDRYCVSSKVFFGAAESPWPTQRGLSRKHVVEACHAALQRLRVDYLDLYFCHRPDPDTPVSEIVWTMHQLIMSGKVLYWGTSEWSAAEIAAAAAFAADHHLIGPAVEQSQYNLLARDRIEREFAPLYSRLGLGTTIFSPLASGLLSGKYGRGPAPTDSRLGLPNMEWLKDLVLGPNAAQRLATVERLQKLAASVNLPLAQIALAWCLRNPNVSTVILGASKPEQLKQNLASKESCKPLNAGFWSEIERVLLGL